MDELRDVQDIRDSAADDDPDPIPRRFPFVRCYLLASVLLVIGAFAIINSPPSVSRKTRLLIALKVTRRRMLFDISVAITAYYHPEYDLATALASNKRARDIINALGGEPIPRVDLVSPPSELVYSTDPNSKSGLSGAEAAAAVSGLATSCYASDYSLTLFNGKFANIATVITANPVNTDWSVDSGGPVAVLVAYKDVSDSLPGVTGLIAPERIAIVAGTVAALFVLLSWIVERGHRFTTRAREQPAGLPETEREIRNQLDVRNVELEEANRAKSQFLSMVSHELKTPLTSIISFTRSLGKSLNGSLDDRQTCKFEVLARNGRQLKLLIDELLDVAAASTGQLRLNFEGISAAQITNRASQTVQPMFETRN